MYYSKLDPKRKLGFISLSILASLTYSSALFAMDAFEESIRQHNQQYSQPKQSGNRVRIKNSTQMLQVELPLGHAKDSGFVALGLARGTAIDFLKNSLRGPRDPLRLMLQTCVENELKCFSQQNNNQFYKLYGTYLFDKIERSPEKLIIFLSYVNRHSYALSIDDMNPDNPRIIHFLANAIGRNLHIYQVSYGMTDQVELISQQNGEHLQSGYTKNEFPPLRILWHAEQFSWLHTINYLACEASMQPLFDAIESEEGPEVWK